MALIRCEECGKEISSSAEHCPHCGCRTKHGTSVVQNKAIAIKILLACVILFVGAFLLFNGWTVFSGHSSYYWEYHSDEKLGLFFKMGFGAALILGGLGAMVQAKNEVEEQQYSEQVTHTPQRPDAPPAYIPENKRKHGTCAKCGAEGIIAECKLPHEFGTVDLCPKCINRYSGQIQ